VGSLERRLKLIEAGRKRRGAQPTREALARLSDEELEALEEALLRPTLSPGEPLPPNPFIEAMKAWEAEATEQRRRKEVRDAKLRRSEDEKAEGEEQRAKDLARRSWKANGGGEAAFDQAWPSMWRRCSSDAP
jgi:hypothetical protein